MIFAYNNIIMLRRQDRIIWCILVSLYLIKANGRTPNTKRAQLKLEFVSYENPLGVTENGACCETIRAASLLGCPLGVNGCDTYLSIGVYHLLSDGGRALVRIIRSRVWENTNEISFGNTLGNTIPNPIIMDLPFWDYNNGYKLEIKVLDEDGGGNVNDMIAQWSKTYKTLDETSDQLSGVEGIRLNIIVSGRCKQNHYGEDCRTECQPQTAYSCNQTTGTRICRPGYLGGDCTEINACESSPCRYGGTCENRVNSFSCQCRPGYRGEICEIDIDYCPNARCTNGVCTEQRDGYQCDCYADYTGRHCNTNINKCNSNPCYGNATCQNGINRFDCSCPPGFTGRLCNATKNNCRQVSCNLNGTCINGLDTFTCECDVGYTGRYCETLVDKCDGHRCSIYGTCKESDEERGYRCLCNEGYAGPLCYDNIDECQSQPCLNNATCDDETNAFKCWCQIGYTGTYCEDDCTLQCVKDQGTCTEGSTDLRSCQCIPGYSGLNCEVDIDECESNPCNGDRCINLENGYQCDRDDKCTDVLISKLASSFCTKILNTDNCDSLIRQENMTFNNATSCFTLHSFKCSALRFLVNYRGNFAQISTNWTDTLRMCSWDFFGDITCYETNSTMMSVGENTYCLNQTGSGLGALVPLVDVPSLTELLAEYWYYFTMAGAVVIVMIIITIICIVTKPSRIKRKEIVHSARAGRHPPLPNLPMADQTDHEYEGMTYTNPTFNSIYSQPSIKDFCNTSSLDEPNRVGYCNIYEEPCRNFMRPISAEQNTFGKPCTIDGRRRAEYYTEPIKTMPPHGECARPLLRNDNVLYAVPDCLPLPPIPLSTSAPPAIPTTLPPPPWLGTLPLPPLPNTADSMQQKDGNTPRRHDSSHEAINEPEKPNGKRRINPLYSMDEEKVTLTQTQGPAYDSEYYVDANFTQHKANSSDSGTELRQHTSVKDRVATLQTQGIVNTGVLGKQFRTNPLYSMHGEKQPISTRHGDTATSMASAFADATSSQSGSNTEQSNYSVLQTPGLVKSKKASFSLKTGKKGKKNKGNDDEVKQSLEKKVNPLHYMTELKAKTAVIAKPH